ncbi:MAG: 1-acyl-sn-glycerol-3-phosphate acyltransferase [Trueperaceae bacterium]|nr:1-acyl-sn-glycerol-3-phosphate acyltransferase [Trueperaceae bacterium]
MTLLERIFSPRWFMPTAIVLVRTFVSLFYGLSRRGLENVPLTGPLVVACNHISSWDPPVVGVAINRKLEFMAKRELFEKPFPAAALRGLRAFPIDRQSTDLGAIKEALRRLAQGRAIGVFIEGSRHAAAGTAFDGAAYLAARSGAKLLPAAIWREGRKFVVQFGEPIETTDSGRAQISSLTSALAAEIRSLLPDDGVNVSETPSHT